MPTPNSDKPINSEEIKRYREIDAVEIKWREDFEEMEQIAYRAAISAGEKFYLGSLDNPINKGIIEKYHKILEDAHE